MLSYRALLVSIVLSFSLSCNISHAPSSPGNADANTISGNSTIPTGSLAILVVNELHEDLVAKTDLTAQQAKTISVKAVGALEIKKLGLTAPEGYEEKIEEFADEIVAGAVDALDEIEAVHQRQINKVLAVIVESIVSSLKGRTSNLSEESLSTLMLSISESAMKSLDEAGFTIQSMAEGARAIVANAVGSLDDSGVLTDTNGRAIVKSVVRGAVRGLKDSPLSASTSRVKDFSTVLDEVMYGAVGSLDDSGFPLEVIDESMLEVCLSGVSELGGLSFTSTEFDTLIQAGIEGALDGLKREAGVSDPIQLANAIAYCAQGAIEGLAQTGTSVSEIDEVVALIVRHSVKHMDNLGISEADTEATLETLLAKSSLGLITAGFNKDRPEEYGDALGDMAFGAIEGLEDVGFNATEIKAYSDEISSFLFASLKEHEFSRASAEIVSAAYKATLFEALAADPLITLNEAEIDQHIQAALLAEYGS